jgi:glutamine amidotransferase
MAAECGQVIGVVNYGIGNLRSVANALSAIGADFQMIDDPKMLASCDKAILPGVGAFGACTSALEAQGFREPVLAHAAAGKPLLGICVGMQMLAEQGTEFGNHAGLGLVPGTVVEIPRTSPDIRLPHVGWSALKTTKDCPLLQKLPADSCAYFVHSYHFAAADPSDVAAQVDYGSPVTAAVAKGAVFGVQFHPEKSQAVGLAILKNFAAL